MKISDTHTKQNIISRLKRIEGQVRGVAQMVENERDCQDVMQQFAAIRSAVQNASLVFLQEFAVNCVSKLEENDPVERTKIVNNLINMIGKAT